MRSTQITSTQVMCFSVQSHMSKCDLSQVNYKAATAHSSNVTLNTVWLLKLTDFTIDGRPHSVLSSLVLWRRPCLSMSLSKTSTPITLGFMGLGYFCIAALVTVSQGWLLKDSKKNKNIITTLQQKLIQMHPATYDSLTN